MRTTLNQPYYSKIAIDIASRISSGEFNEGERIYGRSAMASEYKTSPETIRRALKLLSDMKVVEVRPQSGTTILSRDNALRYISSTESDENVHDLFAELREIRDEYAKLNSRLVDTVETLARSRYSFAEAASPLPNFEVPVPDDSPMIGRNIGSLHFWQQTGATIIAIRRGQNVLISPGPTAELYGGDVIILIGTTDAVNAAYRLVSAKEVPNDPI